MTVEVKADRALGWTRADTIRTSIAAAVAALLLGAAAYLGWTDGEGLGGSNAAFMLLIGAGLGILFERGRYCFFCIFRDLFEKRNSRGMYAIFISIAVGMIGYAVIFSTRVPNPSSGTTPSDAHIAPVSLALIIAGLAFGLGMVISGGCIAGHLYRLPEGHLRSIPALAGVVLGFGLGFLSWDTMYSNFILDAPVPWLPAGGGYTTAVLLQLGVLVGLGIWLLKWNPPVTGRPDRRVDGEEVRRLLFFKRWPALATGAGVGLLAVLAYYKDQPLGVTSQISSLTRTGMTELGILQGFMPGLDERLAGCVAVVIHTITTNGWLILGIVLGSFAAALPGRRIRTEAATAWNSTTALAGGILLGWGAMIGLGCTIGVLLSGTHAMAASGWVFGVAVVVASGIGFRLNLHRRANPTGFAA
ncbi:YeeE/YedE family protein [Nesterenkonia massiliensis]|uniref:YeeE/YedE family protein n=1 Tax=Nesterenkonia massiliensis TaxID=1232429 RepID=A0ABT2HSM4_9MICC|nr:YeeE/YedE family protein [Nesterenkonia massiliensis]MCT1607688.1 YeeE/YedE family protein [Nesterenkonia massiliensis]